MRPAIAAQDSPRMRNVPGGTFLIGSPDDEPGRHKNEGPQRQLSIHAFAVSETEVTVGQFAAFVKATKRAMPTGCDTHGDGADGNWDRAPSASWRSPGFAQGPHHPVVCITWQDARDYAAWLATRTGHPYRLLYEAEWEYAARAGTTTAFYWGTAEEESCAYANGGDRSLLQALPAWAKAIAQAQKEGEAGAHIIECADGAGFTRPVGQLRANAFGLHDMTGNAWEWVEDCFAAGAYDQLSAAGRPASSDGCSTHRARGGSWDDYGIDLRSARRTSALPTDARRNDTGFRVAYELK
jgi:formylglycine-generating enzyme required for sulfatase activity